MSQREGRGLESKSTRMLWIMGGVSLMMHACRSDDLLLGDPELEAGTASSETSPGTVTGSGAGTATGPGTTTIGPSDSSGVATTMSDDVTLDPTQAADAESSSTLGDTTDDGGEDESTDQGSTAGESGGTEDSTTGDIDCPDSTVACGPPDERECIDPMSDANWCGASEDCQGEAAGERCSRGNRCTLGQCLRVDTWTETRLDVAELDGDADSNPGSLHILGDPAQSRFALWGMDGAMHIAALSPTHRLGVVASFREEGMAIRPLDALWVDPDGSRGVEPPTVFVMWLAYGSQIEPTGIGWARYVPQTGRWTRGSEGLVRSTGARSHVVATLLAPVASGTSGASGLEQGPFAMGWQISGSGGSFIEAMTYGPVADGGSGSMGEVERLTEGSRWVRDPLFLPFEDRIVVAWLGNDSGAPFVASRELRSGLVWSPMQTLWTAGDASVARELLASRDASGRTLITWNEHDDEDDAGPGRFGYFGRERGSAEWSNLGWSSAWARHGRPQLSSSAGSGLLRVEASAFDDVDPSRGGVRVWEAEISSEVVPQWSSGEQSSRRGELGCTPWLADDGNAALVCVRMDDAGPERRWITSVQWRARADGGRWGIPVDLPLTTATSIQFGPSGPPWFQAMVIRDSRPTLVEFRATGVR